MAQASEQIYILGKSTTNPMAFTRGSTVTLDLVERVEDILRRAQTPMSRNEILRRLARSHHTTTRARLNAALAYLDKHLVIYDAGRAGVVWLGRPGPELLKRLARAKVVWKSNATAR